MLFSELVKSELLKFNCTSIKEKKAQLAGLLIPWYCSKNKPIIFKTKDQQIANMGTELAANNLVCKNGPQNTLKIITDSSDILILDTIYKSKFWVFFLRGLYLSAGHMCTPQKDYRLTISFKNAALAAKIVELLQLNLSNINLTTNKYSSVIYMRNSNTIEEFLTMIGAVKSCFEFMNMRIYKDLRNKVNRVTNCDNANIDKTIVSAKNQIIAIKKMQAAGQLAILAPKYRLLAKSRLENPQASNSELATTLGVTRGVVGHGFKKILGISNKINPAFESYHQGR
ncbi:MAG: DNA-binding protein WhiA [Oscillospiraceae bacterium]|jgi:DNA-binding protein WhiA|nr:DNA-binding protein WhiA [Oscillospiraceae bacterium]